MAELRLLLFKRQSQRRQKDKIIRQPRRRGEPVVAAQAVAQPAVDCLVGVKLPHAQLRLKGRQVSEHAASSYALSLSRIFAR